MTTSRREFLKSSALLSVGVFIPAAQFGHSQSNIGAISGQNLAPNAFVRVHADNSVSVMIKHLEMGQGTYTGLCALVAEELDADWSQMRAESAPADAALYNNLSWGPMQGTGGSSSLSNSYEQMRKAGAQTRAVLVAAAAKEWNIPAAQITVNKGVISGGGRRASFGEMAAKASGMTVPTEVKLKEAKDFAIIGKSAPRLDSSDKVNGKAKFASDVKRPGQLTAVILRPPRFGARVVSMDAAKTQGMPGVRAIVEIPQGVAIVATNFWSAKKARDAVVVTWDDSSSSKVSTDTLMAEYRALAAKDEGAAIAKKEGDAPAALKAGAKTLEATFEFPYLAHAPMEPLSCVIEANETGVQVWAGCQFQTMDQGNIAGVFGMKPEQVKINTMFAGGSFGRRANMASDYLVECAEVVKALNKNGVKAPVRLLWTREDDIKGGRYRPAYVHTIRAALDDKGNVSAWQQRIVGQSILKGTAFEGFLVKDGVDKTSVEGADNLPYAVPNLLVQLHTTSNAVPVLWWRAVGSTHTAFSTEVMIDELAVAAGKDPVAFRANLLAKHPRHLAVLQLVAEKANWSAPLAVAPSGAKRGRGVAVHESFNSFVAQVVEVTVNADKTFKVDRVVCAVDCGVAVTPDVVRAQMEGGIGFALSAALHGKITLKDGLVEQSNFTDYPMLRINQMPNVEVHIVPSTQPPTGVGEPGVPPLAPALANALAQATGQRLRNLPLKLA
jgi:isoquinoline 1-oxidoreductase subunit beta